MRKEKDIQSQHEKEGPPERVVEVARESKRLEPWKEEAARDPAELLKDCIYSFDKLEDCEASEEAIARIKEIMDPEALRNDFLNMCDGVTIPSDELEGLCIFARDYYLRFVAAAYWAGYEKGSKWSIYQWYRNHGSTRKEETESHDKDIKGIRE